MTEDEGRTRREGLSELAEDAVGFGGQELRLTRDLILRPRAVMDAYDASGSTAGGLYPKPLRYYLTLNGLYLLLIALLGGFERALSSADAQQLAELAEKAGKSEGEFIGDLDQWYSLVSVPLFTIFMAGAAFLLIRRWSPGGDHRDFRQTFTFLNAYSLLAIPIGLAQMIMNSYPAWSVALTFVPLAIVYARVGAGRWWRTPQGAWLKGALLMIVIAIALVPGALLATGLAGLGAYYLP